MSIKPILESTLNFFEPIATSYKLPNPKNDEPIQIITASEYGAIRKLTGYAKGNGIINEIITILSRIWNAIKSIFDRSDWQMAEKAVCSMVNRCKPIIADMLSNNGNEGKFAMYALGTSVLIRKVANIVFERAIEEINDCQLVKTEMDVKFIYETVLLPFHKDIFAALNKEEVAKNIKQLPEMAKTIINALTPDAPESALDNAIDGMLQDKLINPEGAAVFKQVRDALAKATQERMNEEIKKNEEKFDLDTDSTSSEESSDDGIKGEGMRIINNDNFQGEAPLRRHYESASMTKQIYNV